MANNNTSAIIVVMVAICMLAAAIPILIVATQENGDEGTETTEITIVAAPNSDPVDWSRSVGLINDYGIEYLTAELGEDGESIVCTVTGSVTAGTFYDNVFDALWNSGSGIGISGLRPDDPNYDPSKLVSEYPKWLLTVSE